MKAFIKNLKKKFKKNKKKILINIVIPVVALILILIISLFVIGGKKGIILSVLLGFIFCVIYIVLRSKYKLKTLLLIFESCFLIGTMCVILFLIYVVYNAPDFNEELLQVDSSSILLEKNGEEIAKIGTNLVPLEYDEIPEVLIDAIIATEDSRFFEHQGVDWARFLKASVLQLLGQSDAGGASTLTMQVSKNAYTDDTAKGIEGLIRKFTDVYVSTFIIEKNYTKDKIIEFYVNSQWLARKTYGVEQTSLLYFGKSAKDLNVAEAAMIAGLFQAPGIYDPYENPEKTEERRQQVLKLMLRHGYITENEYNVAKKMSVDKIVIPKEESSYGSSNLSPYQSFIDTVVEEVIAKTGKDPYKTPMVIYTTMDKDFQDYVNVVMLSEDPKFKSYVDEVKAKWKAENKIVPNYTWENDEVQSGIAVIDVKNGSVVALGGNRNIITTDTFNWATDEKRQIGSTAKPLYDYGPAIEYRNWSPYNIVVDEPIKYSDGTSINNWNGKFEGWETARVALRGSRNIPALKTFKGNDKSKIIEFVTKLGLSPEICNDGFKYDNKTRSCISKEDPTITTSYNNTLHEAHSIGGYNGETPVSLASAYAAFANGGTYNEPHTFTKVVFQDSGDEYENIINSTKAMSEETAYIISDMLVTTAPNAVGGFYNINGIKYAAKTGTTNYPDNIMDKYNLKSNVVNDLWTVGFNTEYAIGVWYGYENYATEHHNVLSSGQHNKMFQTIGKKVFTNKNSFTKPSGVISVEIETGCPEATLPSEFTPSEFRQTEIFIKGTEPTTISNRFAKLNNVTNLKSTVLENTITLNWDEVLTPEINTENYLNQYFSKSFENQSYLESHVKSRLEWNEKNIGTIGYEIYIQNSDGTLKFLDYVNTNTYQTTVDVAKEYTFVVKTAYSIFKQNMSDGVTTKVNVSSSILPPIDENPDGGEDNPEIPDDSNEA